MNYFTHLIANWKVSLHSLNDFFEHFLHGLIPAIKWNHYQRIDNNDFYKFLLKEKESRKELWEIAEDDFLKNYYNSEIVCIESLIEYYENFKEKDDENG